MSRRDGRNAKGERTANDRSQYDREKVFVQGAKQMNASENEVTLILAAINKVDEKVDGLAANVSGMDRRINGRIRKLERFRWQLLGGAAALSLVLGVALRAVAL